MANSQPFPRRDQILTTIQGDNDSVIDLMLPYVKQCVILGVVEHAGVPSQPHQSTTPRMQTSPHPHAADSIPKVFRPGGGPILLGGLGIDGYLVWFTDLVGGCRPQSDTLASKNSKVQSP